MASKRRAPRGARSLLNPEYPAAHEDLALVYLAQSRPEAALAEVEQEKADLWRRYGFSLVYYALGRHKEADATLAEFVKHYQHPAARVPAPRLESARTEMRGKITAMYNRLGPMTSDLLSRGRRFEPCRARQATERAVAP